jgi:hypothetical protein
MLKWCRYYFLTNPLFHAVISKLSEYPITPISYDCKNEELKKRWKHVLEEALDIQAFLISVGLDYHTYGNCFVTISFPFKKYLRCPVCKKQHPISDVEYKFRDYQYLIVCKDCGGTGPAQVVDRYMRSLKGVKLIRWGPENIGMVNNPITGETVYVYDMPQTLKNDILIGKQEIIEKIPKEFIEALRVSKALQFTPDSMFHLKRAHLAEQGEEWGIPVVFASLKSAFYLQILQKAQEAIAEEHIVPLRVLFPQPSTQTGDPYNYADLSHWAQRVETEIARWRFDQNHIPIMPLPIGQEVIGGDGRALLLHQEIRIWSEHIVAGMGVPQEFVFGGLSWSGSNVSLRMLENSFLRYRTQMLKLIQWIVTKTSLFMNWPSVPVHFTDFKMADDIQRKQLMVNLATTGKVSDRTLLDEMGLDYANEKSQMEDQFKYDADHQKKLMIAQAEAQGEATLVSAKYQKKLMASEGVSGVAGAQGDGQQVGDSDQLMTDARGVASSYAKQLAKAAPAERNQVLGEMQQKYPYLAGLVAEFLQDGKGKGKGGQGGQPRGQAVQAGGGVAVPQTPAPQLPNAAMKPLPSVRPPRRQAASI